MKGTWPHPHFNLGYLLAAISIIIICQATANPVQTVDSGVFNLVEKCNTNCIDNEWTEETEEICTLCIDHILTMQSEEYDTGLPHFHSPDYQPGDEGRPFCAFLANTQFCRK